MTEIVKQLSPLLVFHPMSEPSIFHLSDDLLLKILFTVDSDVDPRHWPRLASVCTRLSALVRSTCYPHKCRRSISAAAGLVLVAPQGRRLLPRPPPRRRPAQPLRLRPRELPDHSFHLPAPPPPPSADASSSSSWSLFDDLFPEGLYDPSESAIPATTMPPAAADDGDTETKKRRRRPTDCPAGAHTGSGAWNLIREEGNKLPASRFKGDALYICGWPGCVHGEEKRKYMLLRGFLKNFERSGVWGAIKDGNRGKLRLGCTFCYCGETYDLLSAFCLRRVFKTTTARTAISPALGLIVPCIVDPSMNDADLIIGVHQILFASIVW